MKRSVAGFDQTVVLVIGFLLSLALLDLGTWRTAAQNTEGNVGQRPSAPAVLRSCDEAGLDAAIAAGGTNTFSCTLPTTITISGTKEIAVLGTVLDGGNLLTISGGGVRGVFIVNGGRSATFQNLSIVNGATSDFGGGIRNRGTVTVNNSTFSGNTAGNGGGGIFTDGPLTVSNTTFSNNIQGNSGGGIYSASGTVTISNSTFSGNTGATGGAIRNSEANVTITNSTFSGNGASGGGGGGIINNSGTVTLKNTIVANSTSGGNCSGTITDGGNNLQFGGAVANSCGASITTADPNLGALTGSPAYFPLGPGSAAKDAGSNATCAAPPVNNTSQNGVVRPQNVTCDIGSVEELGAGFEGDVAPRPGGDGKIQSDDVVQVQRFQIGLDTVVAGSNEFMRADSAPIGTHGDGKIQSDDVVQTQRYQIGLDAMQNTAGPGTPVERSSQQATAGGTTTFREIVESGVSGRILSVQPAYDVDAGIVSAYVIVDAVGDESAYGFTIEYDPSELGDPKIYVENSGGIPICSSPAAGRITCSVTGFADDEIGSTTDQIGEIRSGDQQRLMRMVFVSLGETKRSPHVELTGADVSNDSAEALPIGW